MYLQSVSFLCVVAVLLNLKECSARGNIGTLMSVSTVVHAIAFQLNELIFLLTPVHKIILYAFFSIFLPV